jgi:hypothetical protein
LRPGWRWRLAADSQDPVVWAGRGLDLDPKTIAWLPTYLTAGYHANAAVCGPAARTAACTMKFVPSERDQTAIALPCPSTATCGSYASWPAAERSCGASHASAAHAEPAPPPKNQATHQTRYPTTIRSRPHIATPMLEARTEPVKSIETVGRRIAGGRRTNRSGVAA